MRVLIAEDDPASRLFLKKYLSRYGECDVAFNGMEAIELFEQAIKDQNRYDLICIDVMMPKIDGLKALTIIKKIEKKNSNKSDKLVVPIMTSALNDEKTVKEAYDAGCEVFIWKPIEIMTFDKTLKELKLI